MPVNSIHVKHSLINFFFLLQGQLVAALSFAYALPTAVDISKEVPQVTYSLFIFYDSIKSNS
jgi:hypothetical protein